MKYPQVTEWSLLRYRESLREKRASVSPESQYAIDRLIRTIDAALDHPVELRPDEVEFGVTSLGRVPPDELPAIFNQQTLGVGWDGAPIIVLRIVSAEAAVSGSTVSSLRRASPVSLLRGALGGSQSNLLVLGRLKVAANLNGRTDLS